MNKEDQPIVNGKYRSCVGLLIINKDNKVFIAKRSDNEDAWQMPQGGIDAGETAEEAAKRELYEETGITNFTILGKMPEKLRYDLPVEIASKIWDGEYVGQEQTWVAIQFNGDDTEIDLETQDFIELTDWKWSNPEEIIKSAVSFKAKTYSAVLSYFENHLS